LPTSSLTHRSGFDTFSLWLFALCPEILHVF
jgi:hypothetical protein